MGGRDRTVEEGRPGERGPESIHLHMLHNVLSLMFQPNRTRGWERDMYVIASEVGRPVVGNASKKGVKE